MNNRCKSIKVSYVKSPKMADNVVLNEYYNQKVIIDLTKEQLDAYNNHVREYEKENLNGVNTHSTLKEGENACAPIEVTVSGRVILVKALQFRKAETPTVVKGVCDKSN